MAKIQTSDELMMTALREVVAERPDYVDTAPADHGAENSANCFYVHCDPETGERTPGCLVACALVKVGVPLDALSTWEGLSAGMVIPAVVEGLSPDTLRAFERAQDAQDNGATWRDALNFAEMRPEGVEL